MAYSYVLVSCRQAGWDTYYRNPGADPYFSACHTFPYNVFYHYMNIVCCLLLPTRIRKKQHNQFFNFQMARPEQSIRYNRISDTKKHKIKVRSSISSELQQQQQQQNRDTEARELKIQTVQDFWKQKPINKFERAKRKRSKQKNSIIRSLREIRYRYI